MRKSRREETSHGTLAGQIPIDVALQRSYELTRREAECASLLRHGVPASDLPAHLGVSLSTVKKFLAGLRRKLAQSTTSDVTYLLRASGGDDNVEAHHAWPPMPVGPTAHAPYADASLGQLAQRCRGKIQLRQMLDALREFLALHFRARYVFYVFSPLSLTGLLRDDVVRETLAPEAVTEAFHAAGQVLDTPSAIRVFTQPDSFAIVDGRSADYAAADAPVRRFYDACLADGVRFGITFGFPSGASFVGISISLDAEARKPQDLVRLHGDTLRAAAMIVHSCAWSYGALAARYGLTLRERDMLSLVAEGARTRDMAEKHHLSLRAVAGVLSSARRKLRATSNAEAVAKGMAANLLVFRE